MADPTFETRMRARLRDVLDSQTGPHPLWSDAPAARRTTDRGRRGRWPIRLLAVAALLAIGGGVLSQVGSWQPRIDDASRSPDPTTPAIEGPVIPFILRGQFVAQFGSPPGTAEYPWYFLDLEDAVLMHGPSNRDDPVGIRAEDGTEAAWAGRIVEFTPAGAGTATVVIQAPPPCGEGRYLVRYDEAERRGDPHPWTLTFTQPLDPCADRVAILTGGLDGLVPPPSAAPADGTAVTSVTTAREWAHQPTRLVPGERYSSWSFTEPFQFIMPQASQPEAAVLTWLAPGRLHFSHPWWFGEFLDDGALQIDRCDPGAGSLPDVPRSPQSFESWLRSNGHSIEEAVEIEIDGRTANRYRTTVSSCPGEEPNEFGSRWYLIPTRDDTILFNVYGDTEPEYQVADEIVRSMVFD